MYTLNILNKCFLEEVFLNIQMHHLESVMTQEKLVNAFQLYFLLYNLNLFPLRTRFKRSYNLASTIHGCAKHMLVPLPKYTPMGLILLVNLSNESPVRNAGY